MSKSLFEYAEANDLDAKIIDGRPTLTEKVRDEDGVSTATWILSPDNHDPYAALNQGHETTQVKSKGSSNVHLQTIVVDICQFYTDGSKVIAHVRVESGSRRACVEQAWRKFMRRHCLKRAKGLDVEPSRFGIIVRQTAQTSPPPRGHTSAQNDDRRSQNSSMRSQSSTTRSKTSESNATTQGETTVLEQL